MLNIKPALIPAYKKLKIIRIKGDRSSTVSTSKAPLIANKITKITNIKTLTKIIASSSVPKDATLKILTKASDPAKYLPN